MTASDESWNEVRELFDSLVDADDATRERLLRDASPETRAEVARLLSFDSGASAVLESAAAVPDRPSSALSPGQTVGPYRLTRAIASGGMGVVFEAEGQSPQRRVALKTLRAEFFTPDLRRRFENEIQLLARLDHPGIAHVYSSGTFTRDGQECPYYTMELVDEASSLLEFADGRALPVEARLELFLQACNAVDYGHRKGVIHRDLKPANLLVDSAGRLKVIDFGLARPDDPAALGATPVQTRAGLIFGTLPYMSPEHTTGRSFDIDTQSDVYSLGCILCELLTGKTPHDLEDLPVLAALERIERDEPKLPIRGRNELRWIVTRAVARDRSRRYPSAGALAADIRRFLGGHPVDAAPPSRIYAMRSFARRHRVALASTAAIFLALSIGFFRAERSARAAKTARAAAEAEARVSNEVSVFLSALFTGLGAYRDGADARVAEVLEVAANRVGNVELDDARAILNGIVGRAHLSLSELEHAESYLRDALALASASLPERSIHRLRIELVWADWLEQSARYREAHALTSEVLERGEGVLEWGDLYYARYNLALCESRLGCHERAAEIFRELAAEEFERQESVVRAADLTYRVGAELLNLDRYLEAQATLEEALALYQSMPINDLYAATMRMALAKVRHGLGDLDGAEELLLSVAADYERHGEAASNRALLALTMATVAIERGDLDRAEGAIGEAYALAEQAPAPARIEVSARATEALLLAARGEVAGGVERARSALQLADELAGPIGLPASVALDAWYDAACKDDDPRARLAAARETWQRFRGDDHCGTGSTLRLERYVDALVAAGETEEAEPLARELLARTESGDPALTRRRDFVAACASAD